MPKSRPSAAKVAANARYNEKMIVQFKIGLNKKTDAAIIEHLQSKENKQGYIKSLIIEDMKGGGKDDTSGNFDNV